jgi:NADPH2:quinone reductase
MRAAVVSEVGGAPAVGELPEPPAGDGHVVVDVDVATINPIDVHIAMGRYRDGHPQTPYSPGVEGVGRVDGRRVRFEVVGMHPGYGTNGSLAERAVAPAAIVTELPDAVSDEDAAALGATGITAWRVLEVAGMREGETVAVLGATGAVGRVIVQLARAAGAGRVVAVGRNADGLARAEELGADASVAMNGNLEDLTAQVRDASQGGVDVILDPLWGETAIAVLGAASPGVRLVNFGQVTGATSPVPSATILRSNATIRGISTALDSIDVRRAAYDQLLALMVDGKLTMDHAVWSLDDVGEAWAAQAGAAGRKILVRV